METNERLAAYSVELLNRKANNLASEGFTVFTPKQIALNIIQHIYFSPFVSLGNWVS